MKKWIFLVLVLAVVAIYMKSSRYGIVLGGYLIALDPAKLVVETAAHRFLEDIQFKDFVHAATFHTAEDRKIKDIPHLIEEKFHIKPELLDIKSFEVLRVDVMSNGLRAKALTKVFVRVLNAEQNIREIEATFVFKKEPDGQWYMDLQSSL